MNVDSIIPVVHPDVYQFYITVGLPGVGKTTFCKKLGQFCSPNNFKLISRDEIRYAIICEKNSLKSSVEKNLDRTVSERVIYEISDILKHSPSIRIICIDGCHTLYSSLKWLLLRIQRLMNAPLNRWARYEINLCIVGTPNSICNHSFSNASLGDYRDYKEGGTHDSIPKTVFDLKQKQFSQLIQKEFFHDITRCCEHVILVPSWSK